MAEGIDDQVADVPAGDAEEVEADEAVDDRQHPEEAKVEDELLGEGERDRGKPAVEMAPVMLDVDPMEGLEVECAVRGVVPDLGQDRGEDGRREERTDAGILEAAEKQETGEDHGMKRCMNRIAELPSYLVTADRQIVDDASRDGPLARHGKIPEERHGVAEDRDHDEDDDRCGAHPVNLGFPHPPPFARARPQP